MTDKSEYRPQIRVDAAHGPIPPAILYSPGPGQAERLVASWTPYGPPDPGFWYLVFVGADGHLGVFRFDGQLSEAAAVAAAQDHLLKHGRLHVEVEVHEDE